MSHNLSFSHCNSLCHSLSLFLIVSIPLSFLSLSHIATLSVTLSLSLSLSSCLNTSLLSLSFSRCLSHYFIYLSLQLSFSLFHLSLSRCLFHYFIYLSLVLFIPLFLFNSVTLSLPFCFVSFRNVTLLCFQISSFFSVFNFFGPIPSLLLNRLFN